MPVLDHEVHAATRIDAGHRYGCHNKPRPVAGATITSKFSGESWEFRNSTDCMCDVSLIDPCCSGCMWRGGGEANSEKVRAKA